MHHVSVWRRKALEAFPELTEKIHEDAFSPYALFFVLLPFAAGSSARGSAL